MSIGLAIAYQTDVGRVRDHNEDNICIITPRGNLPGIEAVMLVADGMGGHQAGEVASGFIADKIAEVFSSPNYQEWVAYPPTRQDYPLLVVKEVLERLNEELVRLAASNEGWRGMGTTATIALVSGARVYVGHVGDSRAYLISNGQIRQITHDHTVVAQQIEQGLLSPEEAEVDARRNVLLQALGVNNVIRVERTWMPLEQGDTILLCTDGLTGLVLDEEIAKLIQQFPDPRDGCEALVTLANERGGIDNISVIIAQVVTMPQLSTPLTPTEPAYDELDTQPLPMLE